MDEQHSRQRRRIRGGVLVGIVSVVIVGGIVAIPHPAQFADAQSQIEAPPDQPTEAERLRGQLRQERRARAHQVRGLRTRLREARAKSSYRFRPSVDHALVIASLTYGVPLSNMRAVARCESTFRPWARNGRYVGLFQFGASAWRQSSYTVLSRTDPYANALAHAEIVSDEGYGQWECKP